MSDNLLKTFLSYPNTRRRREFNKKVFCLARLLLLFYFECVNGPITHLSFEFHDSVELFCAASSYHKLF